MANTVTIQVKLDDNGVVQGIAKVKSELGGIGTASEQASQKGQAGFTVLKGVLANLATEGIMLCVNALKEFASDSINTGMEFETSMSKVQALSGASADQLGALESKARELGASTTFSASEAADALGYMALAGWDTEEMLQGVGSVLTLAQAGEMDLAAASDLVTDYLSAFNMTADETGRLVDVLAYAQGNANTTTEGLGMAFKNCAANANAAGLDVETTTAAISMMANQGLKGAEAGTALNAVMRDMTAKMEDGCIIIGDTAVAVMDAQGNYRDFVDILADVEAATDGMGDAEKAAALQTTFTADSIKGLNLLLNAGSDETAKFREELYNCAGTAEETAATMTDNLAGDVAGLQSALSELQLTLYDGVSPALRTLAQTATESFQTMAECFKNGDLQGGVQAISDLIMSVLDQIVQMLPMMAEVAMQLVTSLADGILQMLPAILEVAIQIIVTLVDGIGQALPQLIPAAVEAIMQLATTLLENLPLIIDAAMQLIVGLAEGLINAIPVLVAALPALIEALVSGLLGSVGAIMEAGVQLLLALVDSIPAMIPTLVAAIPQIITSLVTALIQGIPQMIMGAIQLFMGIVMALPQIIVTVVSMIPEIIMAMVNGIIEGGSAIGEAFMNVFGELPSFIQEPLMAIGELFSGVFGAIGEVVGPIIDGIGQGIGWLADTIGGVLGPVVEGIGGAFGWLGDAVGGAWDFITGKSEEASAQTAETVSSNTEQMKSNVEGYLSTMEGSFEDNFNSYVGTATSAFGEIFSIGSSETANLESTVTSNVSSMTGTVESDLNGMVSTSSSAFADVSSTGSKEISTLNSDVTSKASSMVSSYNSSISQMDSTSLSGFNNINTTGTQNIQQMSSSVSASMNEMDTSITSSFDNISNVSTESFTAISTAADAEMQATADAITSAMESATDIVNSSTTNMVNTMEQGCSSITSAWASMHFSTPHIPLPHFSVSGRLDPNVPSVPTFNVNWYAKGGIFNGASIIGVGEAGPEAVVPLSKKGLDPIAEAVAQKVDNKISVSVNIENFVNETNQSVDELISLVERKLEERVARKRRLLGV